MQIIFHEVTAAVKSTVFSYKVTNGGYFNVYQKGELVLTFKPSQLKSTINNLNKLDKPNKSLITYITKLVADGAIKEQKSIEQERMNVLTGKKLPSSMSEVEFKKALKSKSIQVIKIANLGKAIRVVSGTKSAVVGKIPTSLGSLVSKLTKPGYLYLGSVGYVFSTEKATTSKFGGGSVAQKVKENGVLRKLGEIYLF
jgi:hypothetical protein